jgi:hypothetical protein
MLIFGGTGRWHTPSETSVSFANALSVNVVPWVSQPTLLDPTTVEIYCIQLWHLLRQTLFNLPPL